MRHGNEPDPVSARHVLARVFIAALALRRSAPRLCVPRAGRKGFVARAAAVAEHCRLGRGELYQCNACRRQTSLVAGTLMANTKLALQTWFLAIYLISQAKTGLSALALKRQLGVSYPTAWLMHHKLMRAMAQRDAVHRLGGQVQMDDAYLGGERAGGKAGRGSENKVPFVAAVSLSDQGRPHYLKLTPVAGSRTRRSSSGPALICTGRMRGQRWLGLLHGGARCRLRAPAHGGGQRQAARSAAVQVGQHRARQPQDQPVGRLPRVQVPQVRGRYTWPPSPTASTAASICAGSSRGWSSMWPILIPILGMSFGRLRLVANQEIVSAGTTESIRADRIACSCMGIPD